MQCQLVLTMSGILVLNAAVVASAAVNARSSAATSYSQDDATQPAEIESDSYMLDICPVSDQKLGAMGDPVVKTIDGREVRFCCAGCVGEFEADKAKYFAKIDKKMVEQQLAYYPLDTCLVMDDSKLGEMGEPVNHVYKNRLVRFCCKMCLKGFNENPEKFLEKLDKAIVERQREHYPLETCVVHGPKMRETYEFIVGNALVRVCRKGCVNDFNRDPAKYLARLDKAWKQQDHAPGTIGADHSGQHGDHPRNGHGDGHDHDRGDHNHGGGSGYTTP